MVVMRAPLKLSSRTGRIRKEMSRFCYWRNMLLECNGGVSAEYAARMQWRSIQGLIEMIS